MIIFCLLALLLYAINAQTQCSSYTSSGDCDTAVTGACRWIGTAADGDCRCASEVKLDILFGVDASGSIGTNNFEKQRDFLNDLIQRGIGNESRVGVLPFSTVVETSDTSAVTTASAFTSNNQRKNNRGKLPIEFWTEQQLQNYIANLYYIQQWTNTPKLIEEALNEFDNLQEKRGRQSIFIILTDGNPCLASGCGFDVCGYDTDLRLAAIRVLIIAVGSNIDKSRMDCLLEDPVADWLAIDGFNSFDRILGSLSAVLCPVTKRCRVTEVKPMRKPGPPGGWDLDGDGRFTRFIEIWNSGMDFNLNSLRLTGLVAFDGLSDTNIVDVNIPQSSYLVFYDASDGINLADNPSTPTCHVCAACDLTSCTGVVDRCFCKNATYVACTSAPTPDGSCESWALSDGNGETATNICSDCTFSNLGSKTDWSLTITDSVDISTILDEVVYGEQGYWVPLPDKFSYELISIGYNNDVGDNWGVSCNQFGTPGAPPMGTCDETCDTKAGGCGAVGACTNSQCVCDDPPGYYPICEFGSGDPPDLICHTCARVPQIDNCMVQWVKNETHPTKRKYARYTWSDSGYNGYLRYKLTYVGGEQVLTPVYTNGATFYATGNFDPTSNANNGGFVQTEIEVCTNQLSDPPSDCTSYLSTETVCNITTVSPTNAPSFSPTTAPTPAPTYLPTSSPTLPCPRYYWVGGTSAQICDYDYNAECEDDDDIPEPTTGDCPRCACFEGAKQCCLLNPDWSTPFDPNRQHKTRDDTQTVGCDLDVQLAEPRDRAEGLAGAGVSPGYLLTVDTHIFRVAIEPEDYPCDMEIFWELQFDSIECSDSGETDEDCETSAAATAQSAGLEIDVTSGWLNATAGDTDSASVVITVARAECGEDEDEVCDEYESLTLLGNLVIVNATSVCAPMCFDGRIFPMRIPVWYNYQDALTVPPTTESELPAWLWWLVAAGVVFLGMLAFLLYRYWWKNKVVGAALSGVQDDLDAAVMEQEDGFGAGLGAQNVQFNPLSTGAPNASAGVVGSNAPDVGAAGGGQFVRGNVEKIKFKQEYGPNMGKQ